MPALALAAQESRAHTVDALRHHVRDAAERRPGVYEFVGAAGSVFYVGKAKDLRARLLSYFSAPWPDAKGARLIRGAAEIRWRYLPSEFAALLEELRLIKRLRPAHNVRANRTSLRTVFIKLTAGLAPKLLVTERTADQSAQYYGPFRGSGRTAEAVRVLSDLLGLRDCRQNRPLAFADQGDLFAAAPLSTGCLRYELGSCLAPCARKCSVDTYHGALRRAVQFLEGHAVHPIDLALDAMGDASALDEFERAAFWRDKLEALEWLFSAVSRLRAAVEGLSFVYAVRGARGARQDRVYVIRRGLVRAEAAWPRTPIERLAFAGLLERHALRPEADHISRTAAEMDHLLLVMSWFRQHPEEFEATAPYARWAEAR